MSGYQILGLRTYYNAEKRKNVSTDNSFEGRGWQTDNVAEIFHDPSGLMDRLNIPKDERHNLYYTANFSGDKKRQYDHTEILYFDLDSIEDVKEPQYLPLFCQTLGVNSADVTVVCSGNGLHFILRLAESIPDLKSFTALKPLYNALCKKLTLSLNEKSLAGKYDGVVWDRARFLRMPGTMNVKIKGEKPAYVVQPGTLNPVAFDWEKVAEIKIASEDDSLSEKEFKSYRENDGAYAMDHCGWLKRAKEQPARIGEGEWYALASVVGRFTNGVELFQDISKGHPGYSSSETAAKLTQALNRSGPRTCSNVAENFFPGEEGCLACPFYKKIKSPVAIFSPELIATEATGFWNPQPLNKKGEPKGFPTPNYDDLLRAFARDLPYYFDQVTGRIYAFDGLKYVHFDEDGLKAWCESVMEPKPKKNQRAEFASKILANNYLNSEASEKFFKDSILNKINLKNGVFDLEEGTLIPSTKDLGFRYVLPYAYDKDAICPTFEAFIQDVTLGRKEIADTLLDFMAYCFVVDYPDHCFLWLSGTGRNGKSTLTDLMQQVIGAENTSLVMLDGFAERFQIETMNGKLLNIAEETEAKRIPAKPLGTLKALSAGASVLVEAKGERPYNWKCNTKMIFMANEAPKFGTANQAIKSRLLLVPFDKQLEGDGFSKIDRTLPGRLAAELPGIFNLLVTRLREKQAKGPFRVHRNAVSTAEVAELLREGDGMLAWSQDYLEVKPGAVVWAEALRMSYDENLEDAWEKKNPIGKDAFSKRLKNLYPGKITISSDYNAETKRSERRFHGVGFKGAPPIVKKADF